MLRDQGEQFRQCRRTKSPSIELGQNPVVRGIVSDLSKEDFNPLDASSVIMLEVFGGVAVIHLIVLSGDNHLPQPEAIVDGYFE